VSHNRSDDVADQPSGHYLIWIGENDPIVRGLTYRNSARLLRNGHVRMPQNGRAELPSNSYTLVC
jgi:hypothetical protein